MHIERQATILCRIASLFVEIPYGTELASASMNCGISAFRFCPVRVCVPPLCARFILPKEVRTLKDPFVTSGGRGGKTQRYIDGLGRAGCRHGGIQDRLACAEQQGKYVSPDI